MKGERDYAKYMCCISYMVLQFLAGAMARYSMHVYMCKCGFVTFLDVMLRIPLANERSTRVLAWIFAMSLLPYIVVTLHRILFNFLLNVCVCGKYWELITRDRKRHT